LAAAAAVLSAQSQSVAVNSASYQTPVSPASLVTLFGSNLAPSPAQAQLDANGQLPTQLGGLTVQAGGQAAQLLYVSPAQINLVMPASIASGTAQIVVQPAGMGASSIASVEVANAAPALFSSDSTGSGPGAVLNAVTFTPSPFLVETPANLGDDLRTRVALFGTGIRYAGNPFLDQSVTNAASAVLAQARDSAGNLYNLPVEYAGAAPTWFGLDQVNVILPPQLDGLGQLWLMVSTGTASSNIVTIVVNALPAAELRLVGISLAQSSVVSGASVGGTVTLNAPARSGGFTVNLSSSNNFVQTPSSITVPAGQVSANFTLQTNTLGSGSATITAQANGAARSALLIVASSTGPSLSTLTLSAASVAGGTSITGTVSLTGAAPSGGAVVQLSANVNAAQPPATVTIPFGQTSATFTIPTIAVTSVQAVTITATYAGSSQPAMLNVNPVFTFTLSTPSATSGASITGTITLGSPAPAQGAMIGLAANDTLTVQIPPFVTIPSGQTSAAVAITINPVISSRTVTLTATYASVTEQVSLTVVPAGTPTLAGLTLSSTAVKGGTAVTGTVTLSTATTGLFGVTVTLQSSNMLVAQTPASVSVAASQTTATFTITTSPVISTQTATITASAGGVTKTASLTVQ
jgi:uncharacterized protein (TIGR03437 family)